MKENAWRRHLIIRVKQANSDVALDVLYKLEKWPHSNIETYLRSCR